MIVDLLFLHFFLIEKGNRKIDYPSTYYKKSGKKTWLL